MGGLAGERTLPPESAPATGQFKEAKELEFLLAELLELPEDAGLSVTSQPGFLFLFLSPTRRTRSVLSIMLTTSIYFTQRLKAYGRSEIISVCEMSPLAVPIESLLAVLAMKSRKNLIESQRNGEQEL